MKNEIQNTYGIPESGETIDINTFPVREVYVQTLCHDDEGRVFVNENQPILEALKDQDFADSVICKTVASEGYNSASSWAVLVSKKAYYAVTEFLWYSYGGGMTPEDFEKKPHRGVTMQVHSMNWMSDDKAGF